MTNTKDKINWYNVLVGLLLLTGYFYFHPPKVDDLDLNTKTITLSHNIEFIKGGSKARSFHRLSTDETKAAFIIDVSGENASKWKLLDSLKQGDTLTIKYAGKKEPDLGNSAKEIPIYFLQKVGKLYFDTNDYNQSKAATDKRWNWLMLIGGVLAILRGLTVVKSTVAYVLGGISLAVIIILRLLGVF